MLLRDLYVDQHLLALLRQPPQLLQPLPLPRVPQLQRPQRVLQRPQLALHLRQALLGDGVLLLAQRSLLNLQVEITVERKRV